MKLESCNQLLAIFLVSVLLSIPGLVLAKKSSSKSGYCCFNGKIVPSTEVTCKNHDGLFSESKSVAQQKCAKSSPSQTKIKNVYCCLNDYTVKELSKEQCKKKHGIGYKAKGDAVNKCKPKEVICCDNGEIKKLTASQCKERSGKSYKTIFEAKKKCLPDIAYCCIKGEVKKLPAQTCEKYKSKIYSTYAEANRTCKRENINCCLEGNVRQKTLEECKKQKGTKFLSKTEANQNCGWCFENDSVYPTIRDECIKKKGKFYPKKHLADNAARMVLRSQLETNGNKHKSLTPLSIRAQKLDNTFTAPETVPFSVERGIRIINPAGDEKYYQGETIIVIFRVSNSDIVSGSVKISVKKAGGTDGAVVSTTIVPVGTSTPVSLTLPADVPTGEYKVIAEHLESDPLSVYGESDAFRVHRNLARIDFFDIERDDVFNSGSTMNLHYKFNYRVEPGIISFKLYHDGAELASQTQEYIPKAPSNHNDMYHLLQFTLPSGIPSGNYTLFAFHPKANGFTPRFSVEPFGEGGLATANDIEVVSPANGASWPLATTQTISWRVTGGYLESRRFNVTLLRGGAPLSYIGTSTVQYHADTGLYNLNYQVPQAFTTGTNYRIKVVDRDGPAEGISNLSIISPPITMEGIMPNETRYFSNPMTIRWRLVPTASIENVAIFLTQTDGDVLQILKNRTPASSGEFQWPVGGNVYTGDGWHYSSSHGERLDGGYRIRVQDYDNPDVYDISPIFYVERPRINVTINNIGTQGFNVSWSSPHLDSSLRVNIDISFYDSSHGAYSAFCVATGRTSPGSLNWRFGDACSSGAYPSNSVLPSMDAHFLVRVPHFEGASGESASFTLQAPGL